MPDSHHSRWQIQKKKMGKLLFWLKQKGAGLHRPDPQIISVGALDTQTFFIEAAVTVPSTAEPALLNQYHIILFRRFAARYTSKFLCHNHTPFRTLGQFVEK
jgi:hypothetical protein